MKGSRPTPRLLAALLLASVPFLLSGCVSHVLRLIVPRTGDATAVYELNGDTLDVYDRRVPLPAVPPWTVERHELGEDSSGNAIAEMTFSVSLGTPARHPLAPLPETGSMTVDYVPGLFRDQVLVSVRFPGWHALDRYGDPDAYIPADLQTLEETGMDSTLSEDGKEQLSRIKAEARQLATVDRYLRQVERVVRNSAPAADSTVVVDAIQRFSPVLRAYLMSLHGDALDPVDPRDVSTEWYDELRPSMVAAAVEANGVDAEYVGSVADSLEREYKRWLDLRDDDLQVAVVLEGWGTRTAVPTADTSGDTLFWTLSPDDLAREDVELAAIGSAWKPLRLVLAGLAVLAALMAVVGLLRRMRR